MFSITRRARPHRALALLLVATVSWAARSAHAEPPDGSEDEPMRPTLRVRAEDDAPRTPKLFLDLTTALGISDEHVTISGGVVVSGTFDDLFVPPRIVAREALAKAAEEPERPPEPPAAERVDAAPRAPAVDGALARGAVQAALRAHRAGEHAQALDDLATRARASGAMPELRVRVARVVDEGQSLSPTEYDPDRVTATGGTSLWLEGRASFQLDKLVFASDELAVERLRLERERFERELVEDVVAALAVYERAAAVLDDEAADADARLRAELDLAVVEAKLDVLTAGWFGAHGPRVAGAQPAKKREAVARR
ncbi:MAG TPA: hypothetical protein VL400_24795 [Polyangiaceae bacterium]|jgi:hypothetical protein|nr:hypothetical protein [Polyangiaceae bacterium]